MKTSNIANRPTLIEYNKYRFLIMDAPTDANIYAYIQALSKFSVSAVVRACEPSYSVQPLVDAGISVTEMSFNDGEPPPEAVVSKWLDLVEQVFGVVETVTKPKEDQTAIAVHCVAGLGRAPVLVAVALVEGGMDPYDAIEFIRQKRRGAINAKQLKFIESYRPRRNAISSCGSCVLL